jgi:hypothetical protein
MAHCGPWNGFRRHVVLQKQLVRQCLIQNNAAIVKILPVAKPMQDNVKRGPRVDMGQARGSEK